MPDAPTPPVVGPITTITPEVVVPPAAPQTVPPVQPPTTSQAGPPPAAPQPVAIGEDGDIPGDAELLTLSKSALSKRLARATRTELRERFGTDNPDDIKAKLDKLATFEAQQEEQRLASLSELEREREAKAKTEGERDEWKRQYDELVASQMVRKAHTRVSGFATKHFADDAQELALLKFQNHLQTLSDDEMARFTDEDMDRWFAAKAKELPRYARATAPAAPVREEAPLTNGMPPPETVPPQTGSAGQQAAPNYSPSAPNAMKPGDARAAAAKEGYRW